jgi:hypothetical protein
VASGVFHLIFMDSITIVEPEAEAEKTFDDAANVRAHASLVTNFIKKYTPYTNTLDGRNFTTLVATAQVRGNQERANAPSYMQKALKPWAPTGAYAARHGKLVDVVVNEGGKVKRTIQGKEQTVGKTLKWEILKGKAGCHDNVFGEAPFIYSTYGGNGVDLYNSIVLEGVRRGVILQEEKKVFLNYTRGGKEHVAASLNQLIKSMKMDFDLELQVRQEILAAAGIQCLYR